MWHGFRGQERHSQVETLRGSWCRDHTKGLIAGTPHGSFLLQIRRNAGLLFVKHVVTGRTDERIESDRKEGVTHRNKQRPIVSGPRRCGTRERATESGLLNL